jgi:transglutaminase-like putative cysteine protease/tetratricopeptide (TPR) repeat protein
MPARPLALVALAAVVLVALPASAATAPWDGPALLGDPAAMLAAAQALEPPRGAEVDTLLEEGVYKLDARGAATFTYRVVFRPLGAEAARTSARVSASWSPWHQARPEIKARVITPDGTAHLLDPATLAESGVREEDRETFTDRRVLAGPLPAVRAGAIVEEVITIRDTAPFFEGGSVQRFYLGGATPTRVYRLRVETPAALPFRHVVKGVALKGRESVANGTRTLRFERTDVPASGTAEPYGPFDATPIPYVAFSTARSWADVAARYGAIVERQLANPVHPERSEAAGRAESGGELATAARAAKGDATERREVIRRVVAWAHANVRYTGLELGEAAIVPVPPAETLRRRYGDCKDLSLLLVGLLRAAGVDARLALVRAEWQELDPELPGFGAFNHAIVRVEGPEGIWIDATDPETPPGKLPPPIQGRLALVVPDGKDLVRTPESTSAENRLRITRELRLAELGPGRIIEQRALSGAFAAEERRARNGVPEAQRREAEERFAKGAFHAEKHVGTRATGLENPSDDVAVRIEVEGSKVAMTADDAAEVPVTPEGLFEPLPTPIVAPEGHASADARHTELVLPVPFQSEVVYRVFPPDGFRARPVPEPLERRFGPALLARTAKLEPDGTVTVRWTLDSGGRRLAGADATALAKEARRISKERPVTVKLERTGAALLAAGKVPEALAEMRRLAALHPNEATHHLHLALGLLGLGFQEAALGEARRGIALEPNSAWAHRVLTWVLSHDAVGRPYGPGFDRTAAIAAARKAKELEPSHGSGRAALAALLAMNADGTRHGPGAQLDEAIAELRATREELGDRSHDAMLLGAYFAANRIDDAIALAREMDRGEERDAILIAAIAVRDGAETAASDAETLGEDRRKALQGASGLLVHARRYPLASAVAAAAASGAPNAAALRAQADTLAEVRPWEELLKEGDAPTRLVRRLFHALYLSATPEQDVAALVAARGAGSPGAPGPAAAGGPSGAPVEASVVRRFMRESGAPPAVLLDLTLARLQIAAEGDDRTGWRVRLQLPWSASGGNGSTLFLVKEKGGLAILASDELLPVLGAEALRHLEEGDRAGARRLLEWARADLPPAEVEEGSPAAVVGGLWRAGAEVEDAALRRAAAALLAYGDRTGPAIPILDKAYASEKDPATRKLVGFALAQAYRGAGKDADLLRHADAMLKEDPASRAAFSAKAAALVRLKRAAEVRVAAEAILARLPEDPQILRTLASAEMSAGALDRAAAAWKRLLDTGRAAPMDHNNAAWLELFRSEVPPKQALDWSRRATDGGRAANDAALNTLAAIYAALGNPQEAREVFVQSMAVGGTRAPQNEDWLVFGWIAEGFGLTDAAAVAYRKVKDDPEDPVGAMVLAKRRLAKLQKAPATTAQPKAASTR